MLPPRLAELKAALIAKGYNARRKGEDELLAELEAIDKQFESSQEMRKIANDAAFTETRMTSPPAGQCPCCGR